MSHRVQPGDGDRDVEGEHGRHVQDVQPVAEEVELVRTGDQAENVLEGEPDNRQGLQAVNEAVLDQAAVLKLGLDRDVTQVS